MWSADSPFWRKHFQFLGKRWSKHCENVSNPGLSDSKLALPAPSHWISLFSVLTPLNLLSKPWDNLNELRTAQCLERCGPLVPSLLWWGNRDPDKTRGMETWTPSQLSLMQMLPFLAYNCQYHPHCKSQCAYPSISLPILWLWTLMSSSPFWISLFVLPWYLMTGTSQLK